MGELAKAVSRGIDNNFIRWADSFGKSIQRVTTSQIRNIFGSVKKMEMAPSFQLADLLLLKPRIAYAQKRNQQLGELARELIDGIDAVDAAHGEEQRQRFNRFCQGFEAILAYHKAHGGK